MAFGPQTVITMHTIVLWSFIIGRRIVTTHTQVLEAAHAYSVFGRYRIIIICVHTKHAVVCVYIIYYYYYYCSGMVTEKNPVTNGIAAAAVQQQTKIM